MDKKMDYLTTLEAQCNDTENQSALFGSVSIVNSKLISQLVEELKAARKVFEAARVASKVINNHYLKEPPHDEDLWFARDEIDTALKKLNEATNGDT